MRNTVRVLCIAVAAVLAAGVASAQSAPVLGDVNGDGVVNVLDIQAAIVQALGVVPPAAEVDVDGNAQVDVADIQHLINTALGTGGLVQRIKGDLAAAADLLKKGVHLVAVSQDGDQVAASVDPSTGTFNITLPIKKQWSFVFATDPDANGQQDAGSVQFPINGDLSTLLPLLDLSHCDVLDLGTLNFGSQITVPEDLRALLASINRDDVLKDADGNGIPDILDKLLGEIAKIPVLNFGTIHLDFAALVDLIKPCIQDHIAEISNVSLVDDNNNRIPDFLDPFLLCLRDNLKTWLQQSGVPAPDVLINVAMQFIQGQLPQWLPALNVPALADANGNGIPDILEGHIGRPHLPPAIDANGNGIPDFLEHRPPHGGEGEGEGEGELVAVPNLVGMALTDAQAAITAAGLVVGPVGHQFNATAPVDQVIDQRPPAGKMIPADVPVGLVVSKGPRPEPVAVPDLVGMTEADAQTALTGAGFVLGMIVEIHDATVPAGNVIHQLPCAGMKVPPGVPVNLVVSLGPAA